MKKMHVKRGDTVKVIAGKDKGKEGKIITAIPAGGRGCGRIYFKFIDMCKSDARARW